MKSTLCLISILILVLFSQNINAREHGWNNQKFSEECEKYAVARSDRHVRGIKDVWNRIKESALQSWNYIKGVAEEIKKTIKLWVESVKEYAYQIKQNFEEKLEDLKQKLNDIISDIYDTGEQLKQCIQKEKEDLELFLKTLTMIMSECIYDEIQKLPNTNLTPQLEFNQTQFARQLDERVELCERDTNTFEDCIFKAREDIFDNFTTMELDILKTHYESRGVVDEIKSSLLTCSLNHILDATNFVTNKAFEVINCVKDGKYDEIDYHNYNEIN